MSHHFSLALQTIVRLRENPNSIDYWNKEINLPPGLTPSVSPLLSQRVIQWIHFGLIVRMDTIFSFQLTKSLRLTRSWWIQMLRIWLLRYWTRSTGVASVPTSTTKSSKSVNQDNSMSWVVCMSRWSGCNVRRAPISSKSTMERSSLTYLVWDAQRTRRMNSRKGCVRRRHPGMSRTEFNRRSSLLMLKSIWLRSSPPILIGILILITLVMQVVVQTTSHDFRRWRTA